MERKYFGTDGVRGIANRHPMTAEFVMRLGMATGVYFRENGGAHRVAIAKDTRISGYLFENALVAGFISVGMDVLQLGPMPTPALSMLTRSLRADLGVMLSASHNLFHDNGIKLFGGNGYKLSDSQELAIEQLVDSDLNTKLSDVEHLGRAQRIDDAQARYIEFAKRTVPQGLNLAGLRVVVDCANGAAYQVAPQILWELGAEVISLNDKPDGFNINKECGSTDLSSLIKRMREVRGDIGLALDGDADRVMLVDERGQVIDGDQILAVVASHWRDSDQLSRQGVVSTIMANRGLERYLSSIGLSLERTKVGDRYVMEAMTSGGYNLGGEPSGHVVMSNFVPTGDGLIAALQVLTVLKCQDKQASMVCHRFEPTPQVTRNVRYSGNGVLERVEVQQAINSGKEQLGQKGRLVIRKSGTESLIRVMSECEDQELAKSVVDEVTQVLHKADDHVF